MCETCSAKGQKNDGCNARKLEGGTWEDKAKQPLIIDGEEDWACPRRPIKDEPGYWSRILGMYRDYNQGLLADEGKIASQSNRGWNMITILDGFIQEAKFELWEQSKEKTKSKVAFFLPRNCYCVRQTESKAKRLALAFAIIATPALAAPASQTWTLTLFMRGNSNFRDSRPMLIVVSR